MKFKKAEKIIKENLVGHSYSELSVGDWWTLYFSNGLWIVTQEIESVEENKLNKLLTNTEPSVLDGVDPEYVAKNIVLSRNLRKEVTNASISDDGALKLFFDKSWEITFPSSADIVDWQWCLNRSGNDPYKDFIVACFWAEEIEISK